MKLKLLGPSGLRVSELCLGTMTFGNDWGWGADDAESHRLFERFVAAGGNFIDTANNYTDGSAERLVGECIADQRDRFVVATKYTLRLNTANAANANEGGNSRKSLRRSVERSLRTMNTDYIDLLYLHMWDFTTPVEEVLRTVSDLVAEGKVLYFAFSDSPAWVVTHAIAVAERYGWPRPVAIQLPYSVTGRGAERAEIPMARTFGLSVTPWGLLSGGVLTGKYNEENDEPRRYEGTSDRGKALAAEVGAIARDINRSPAQVAINWVRAQGDHIIPIIGARTVEQLEDNLGVLDFTLTDEQVARLSDIADFKVDFPYSFLTSDNVRNLIFGDSWERLEALRGLDR